MKKFSQASDSDQPENLWRHVGLATELGGAILAPILVGGLLGSFLDHLFNTRPWLTLILLISGVLAGLRSLFKMVIK